MSPRSARRPRTRGATRSSGEAAIVHQIAKFATSKHAEDIVALDMRGASLLSEYFVVCSGQTARQVKAIADAIWEGLESEGMRVGHVEGYHDATWILLDCGEALVHVFHPSQREFYALERLWGDMPRIL